LICSSLTVVLAHFSLGKGDVRKATLYILITLALGCVFLVVKAFEYRSKFSHGILPGHVFEKLDGPTGPKYLRHVQEQLQHIVDDPVKAAGVPEAARGDWKEFLVSTGKIREFVEGQKKKVDQRLADEGAAGRKAIADALAEAEKKSKG